MSCSETKEEIDELEIKMAKQLETINVQLSHFNTSRSVNEVPSGSESYLQLNIIDSKVLEQIDHNKRLMSKKSDEIKDIVLSLPHLVAFPAFNELRLNVIEINGFAIFESKKVNTITYRIH